MILFEDILRVHARKYVPTDMRPMVWQLLLGYLPEEKSKRETVLLSKQKLYPLFLVIYFYFYIAIS